MRKFMRIIYLFMLLLISSYSHAIKNTKTQVDIIENVHFYIGAGVGYSFYSLNNEFEHRAEFVNRGSVERHAVELSGPIVGIKFQDGYGFGAELGYSFHDSLSLNGIKQGKLAIRNTFIDFMNYLPIATDVDDIKVEILAGFGLGHLEMREYGTVGAMGAKDSYKKYGLRAKVGMQYNFNNHWSMRGLLAYQKVGARANLYAINSAKSISLDIIYII